jgi:hypothetical protein
MNASHDLCHWGQRYMCLFLLNYDAILLEVSTKCRRIHDPFDASPTLILRSDILSCSHQHQPQLSKKVSVFVS